MNNLSDIFHRHNGHLVDKWSNYLEVYDRHFSKYRGKEITLVEFGVFQGGSLEIWREYFGPKINILGIDINPECKKFENERTSIMIGDQGDPNFLNLIKSRIPRIDILVDDASHFVAHQISTFEILYPHISEEGIYVCEDNHTSYWPEYGGKHLGRGTFVEYTKRLIDELHGWHAREGDSLKVTDFTRSAHAMHFYDSILVVEKRPMSAPQRLRRGTATITNESFDQSLKQGLMSRMLRATKWLR